MNLRSVWRLLVVAWGVTGLGCSGHSPSRIGERGPEQDKPRQAIEFDTDEGTYMCVDVSPDGNTLVFDLLGDLYTLPITGGRATPLLPGRDWVQCPRYSPDGQSVAFISDRGKTKNLWVLDVRSRAVRQLTDLGGVRPGHIGVDGTPIWRPASNEIAYLLDDEGSQIAAVPATGGSARFLAADLEISEFSSPAFTPDGQAMVFSARNRSVRTLYRLAMDSGTVTALMGADTVGDNVKPVLSRSGRYLAYVHSGAPLAAELRVRDLQTGEDRELLALPDAADIRNSGGDVLSDVYPGYAFTPDDRELVIWSQGKLYRVSVADGAARVIPFTVHVIREVAQPVHARYRISDAPLHVRSIRWPALMPDGRKLIFSAVGSLWTMHLPGGKPERLTTSADFEVMPSVSPDGMHLAYVALASDGRMIQPGRLLIRHLSSGETRVVTTDTAAYWLPNWSPDGQKIAVLREEGHRRVSYGWVDVASGRFHDIAPAQRLSYINPGRYIAPHHIVFSRDGRELLFVHMAEGNDYTLSLRSTRLDGTGTRDLLTAESDITGIFPSPDRSAAVVLGWDYDAYLVPLPYAGEPARRVSIHDSVQKTQLQQVSRGGALYPRWLDDTTLIYGWTTTMFRHRVGEDSASRVGQVQLTVPRRGATGVLAFRNARLITLSGERGAGRVIERGTLVVRGTRIAAVGPVDSIAIPPEATVVDASGLTIMPALIDAHGHGFTGSSGVGIPIGGFRSEVRGSFAYGITTAWEAAGSTADDATISVVELIEAGRLRGGRWFSAAGMINLLELDAPKSGVHYRNATEMRNQVRRRVELGAGPCLKQKNSGQHREASQWFAEAGRQFGACVVAHVSSPAHMLSRVADGFAVDHPPLWAPAYRDVKEFLVRAGTVWTMHVFMAGSLTLKRNSWDMDLVRGALLEGLGPRKPREIRRQYRLLGYVNGWMSASPDGASLHDTRSARLARLATELVAAGGKIAGGSTDGAASLENHVELWAFYHAGMPAGDVLRTATMFPAAKLGLQEDLGSLEVGKLADLIVLDRNPLERIENTIAFKYTLIAGIIYDSETLEEVSPLTIRASNP